MGLDAPSPADFSMSVSCALLMTAPAGMWFCVSNLSRSGAGSLESLSLFTSRMSLVP